MPYIIAGSLEMSDEPNMRDTVSEQYLAKVGFLRDDYTIISAPSDRNTGFLSSIYLLVGQPLLPRDREYDHSDMIDNVVSCIMEASFLFS